MKSGYFGDYGGQYVSELLMPPLLALEVAMESLLNEKEFKKELNDLLVDFGGRETPLTFCQSLSADLGFKVWLKREDLLHTGAHKLNNTLGQALLAKKMGKTSLVAETGAGQHGVATAAAAAKIGLTCKIFMGAKDVERQALNVARMKLFGAEVVSVAIGSQTLKDAINEALRYWIVEQDSTHYCFGTAAGPHPFPLLVKNFQKIIGEEAKAQLQKKGAGLPDYVVACVGGGSNAIGIFADFIKEETVKLIGVEGGGSGKSKCNSAAPINLGRLGILHGQLSMLLQDDDGLVLDSDCIAAGLDYPGVGPEHAYLSEIKRAHYDVITDDEALDALKILTLKEGIIPAMESSHAVAWAIKQKGKFTLETNVLICLSGRGDKDMDIIENAMRKRGISNDQ